MPPIGRVCQNCGEDFVAYTHGKKFCGRECRLEYKAAHTCPGPSLDNCLNCKFDDCIGDSITATKEEGMSINKSLGRGITEDD